MNWPLRTSPVSFHPTLTFAFPKEVKLAVISPYACAEVHSTYNLCASCSLSLDLFLLSYLITPRSLHSTAQVILHKISDPAD